MSNNSLIIEHKKWLYWEIDNLQDFEDYDIDYLKDRETAWVVFPHNVTMEDSEHIISWLAENDTGINKANYVLISNKRTLDSSDRYIIIILDHDLFLLFKLTWC